MVRGLLFQIMVV